MLDSIEDDDKHLYFNSWLVGKVISQNSQFSPNDLALIKLFANYKEIFFLLGGFPQSKNIEIFQIPDVKSYLRINYYDGVYYLNKEQWENLLDNLFIAEFFEVLNKDAQKTESVISKIIKRINFLKKSAKKVDYDLTKLITDISV